jgi:DNA-binding transcriptional MerR regulator
VSKLVGVRAYVLRYWETEFAALAPKKSGTGQRLYRRKDVELLLQIKHLLYDKRFTIEGARRHLDLQRPATGAAPDPQVGQGELFAAPPGAFEEVRKELVSILELLK